MEFSSNHVMQFLVIDHACEYIGLEFFSCYSIIHYLSGRVSEPTFDKPFSQALFRLTTENSSIDNSSLLCRDLATNHLEKVANCHS
jgi:hypothetical protein